MTTGTGPETPRVNRGISSGSTRAAPMRDSLGPVEQPAAMTTATITIETPTKIRAITSHLPCS
jgi:hypothetical protein